MQIKKLTDRGIVVMDPPSTFIGEEVNPENIGEGTVIFPGCRLLGKNLSIGPDSKIGEEMPVTLDNCQLGHGVKFKGGFAQEAVFLDGVSMGSASHIRPSTLLEEQASVAHAVGLKQTIFFPYVTAGSLINFCDALMAGGTGRKDHSEMGSSFVHFNFTPHGDKATPSLLGDVPRGVMLDQRPIFLGGQGGMVGPLSVEYGTVLAAGSILREDIHENNRLVMASSKNAKLSIPYNPTLYREAEHRFKSNIKYIGNIYALKEWYVKVRSIFLGTDAYRKACWKGAIQVLDAVIKERVNRLEELCHNLKKPFDPEILLNFSVDAIACENRNELLASISGGDYLKTIHALPSKNKKAGTAWLQGIVNHFLAKQD